MREVPWIANDKEIKFSNQKLFAVICKYTGTHTKRLTTRWNNGNLFNFLRSLVLLGIVSVYFF